MEDTAEAALDRYDEAERESKQKKRPGVHRYATPIGIGGVPIEGWEAREEMLAYAAHQSEFEHEEDELAALGVQVKRPEEGYDASEYGELRVPESA